MPQQKGAAAKKICFRGRRDVFYWGDSTRTLLLTGDGTMKTTALMVLTGLCALLFTTCDNNVEFVRIIKGKHWGLQPNDSSWYSEYVLVKGVSWDITKRSKMMIAYYDSVGLSINDLKKMPEINHYFMYFYRLTYDTKYLIEQKEDVNIEKLAAYNDGYSYLGYIYVGRCKKDNTTMWKTQIGRNNKTVDNYDVMGPKARADFLQKYGPCLHEAHEEDNELAKYYNELKNK